MALPERAASCALQRLHLPVVTKIFPGKIFVNSLIHL